jgi:hypothetical protein
MVLTFAPLREIFSAWVAAMPRRDLSVLRESMT